MATSKKINVEDLFKKPKDVKIEDQVKLLSENDLDEEKISNVVRNAIFDNKNANSVFLEILKGYKDLSKTPTKITNFNNNLKKIITQACLHSKISSIIDYLVEKKFFQKREFEKNFKDMEKEEKAALFKTIYENTNDKSLRNKIIAEIDKELLLDFVVDMQLNGNSVDKFFCRDVLEQNNADLNAEIIKGLKSSNKSNVFQGIVNASRGMPSVPFVDSVIDGLNDTEFGNLIVAVVTDAKMGDIIINVSPQICERMMSLKPKEFATTFKSLEPTKKAKILDGISDEEKLKSTYSLLSDDEKKAVLKTYENPSISKVKSVIEKTTKNVTGIKSDYGNIRKNIWNNRFDTVKKSMNKVAAKVLEIRIERREEKLLKLSALHSSEDRLGIIGRAQLLLYMRSAKKYEELNQRLDARRKNIDTIEKNMAKRVEKNAQLKEDIAKRKEIMAKNSKIAQVHMKNKFNLIRMKRLLEQETIKKVDKNSKIEISEEQLQLAWSYVLNSGADLKGLNQEKIARIITTHSVALGNLTTEEITQFAREMNYKLEAIKNNMGVANLQEEVEELAGMHMGMSNYLVIIAVTAMTVIGLIIILTIILS